MSLFGIRSLLGLADKASEQLEYWKEYEGEEILIRSHQLDLGDDRGDLDQTSYVIKGTVDDVMSFPPGFFSPM